MFGEIILAVLPLPFVILISFALGYGVRELISRRRRAAERKQFKERHGLD
jgi:hypothetical protein